MKASKMSFLQVTIHILKQGLKAEFAEKDRLIAPVLFAAIFLTLFAFTIGDVPEDLAPKILLAETYLTMFVALQLGFSRIFEADTQDKVFETLRIHPVPSSSWFIAKLFLVIIFGLLILTPTYGMSTLLAGRIGSILWQIPIVCFALLTLIGLSALGVLLAGVTLGARSGSVLFSLVYFPLSIPPLLAAIEGSLQFLDAGKIDDTVRGWFTLLIVFDVIYLTLGSLLFEEFVGNIHNKTEGKR